MCVLVEWLQGQLQARQWSNNELARQAGLSSSGVSQVMTGVKKPGLKFCFGVAEALNEPPEKVLRLAGFLPKVPARDEEIEEIAYHYSRMAPAAQKHFRIIARALGDARLRGGEE
jgi:transcriptional regulator with XRE-family HTH domain